MRSIARKWVLVGLAATMLLPLAVFGLFIQSFEVSNLKALNRMTRLSLVRLINEGGRPFDFVVSGDPRTYADLVTPAGLRDICKYADGIGANKNLIVPRAPSGELLLPPTSLVRDAHRAGLLVHAWTFRNENTFLPADFRIGDPTAAEFPIQRAAPEAEYHLFFGLGIDGLFSDQPDTAVGARSGLPRRK